MTKTKQTKIEENQNVAVATARGFTMNLNEKPTSEKYKEFYGKNTEQMQKLISEGRVPMTMKQIIERRLNSKQGWKDNYFDTCDAIVYGENGKFKIIKNCKILKEMTSKTILTNGAIKLSEKEYKNINGKEFNNPSKEEVWKYLLEDLYEPYIKILNYCPEYYVSDKEYILRALYVGRLEYWSRLGGNFDLDCGCGRLVGVVPEAPKISKNWKKEIDLLEFAKKNYNKGVKAERQRIIKLIKVGGFG
jgi:hypothetical protein